MINIILELIITLKSFSSKNETVVRQTAERIKNNEGRIIIRFHSEDVEKGFMYYIFRIVQ